MVKTELQLPLIPRVVLIAGSLALCVVPAFAQMDPGGGTKPSAVDKKASTAIPGKEKPGPTLSAQTERKTTETSLSPEGESAKPKPPTSVDPITTLREEIDAAPTAEEKASLQLKLVDLLTRAGKTQEARSQLAKMLGEDRFDPQTFYNIGNAFARLGNVDGAIVSYRKAIDQRKGRYSKALNNLGVVLMRRGDWQEANDALVAALKLETFRYAEASYNLGRLYAAQGQMDLAIREWRRALRVDPNHSAAAQAIARAGTEEEVTVAAVQPVAETRTGKSVVPASQPKESTRNTKLSSPPRTATSPKNLSVDPVTFNQLQRARDAHERGKEQEAIANYRSVISRMGGYFAPANLELSYILIGIKQPNDALTYLKPVTTRDGARYPISYYHLARIYEGQDELGMAAEAYGQAATFYHGVNPQFLLDISRVREKRGDYKGALTAMEEYLAAVEQQGIKPPWSEERLSLLRQKLSTSQPK